MDFDYVEFREEYLSLLEFYLEENNREEKIIHIGEGLFNETISFVHPDKNKYYSVLSLEVAYMNYVECGDMEQIVEESLQYVLNKKEEITREELESLDNVLMCAENTNNAEEAMKQVPHVCIGDMSIWFKFYQDNENAQWSSVVTEGHLNKWNLTVNELFERIRVRKNLRVIVEKGSDILNQAIGLGVGLATVKRPDDPKAESYFIYEEEMWASVIFCPEELERFKDKLGETLLIIPATKTQAILYSAENNPSELQEMHDMQIQYLKEENRQRHLLSEQVYHYDMNTQKLTPIRDLIKAELKTTQHTQKKNSR